MKKISSVILAVVILLCGLKYDVAEAFSENGIIYIADKAVSMCADSFWKNDNGTITQEGANSRNYNVKVVAGYDSEGNPNAGTTEIYFKNLNINVINEEKSAGVYVDDIGAQIILEGKNTISLPNRGSSCEYITGIEGSILVITGKGKLTIEMGTANVSRGICADYQLKVSDGAEVIIKPNQESSPYVAGIVTDDFIGTVSVVNAKISVEAGAATSNSFGILGGYFNASEAEVFVASGECSETVESTSAGIYVGEFINDDSNVVAKGNAATESYGLYTGKFHVQGFVENEFIGKTQGLSADTVYVPLYDADAYIGEPVPRIILGESENAKAASEIEYDGNGDTLKEKLSDKKYVNIETYYGDVWYGWLMKILEPFFEFLELLLGFMA